MILIASRRSFRSRTGLSLMRFADSSKKPFVTGSPADGSSCDVCIAPVPPAPREVSGDQQKSPRAHLRNLESAGNRAEPPLLYGGSELTSGITETTRPQS